MKGFWFELNLNLYSVYSLTEKANDFDEFGIKLSISLWDAIIAVLATDRLQQQHNASTEIDTVKYERKIFFDNTFSKYIIRIHLLITKCDLGDMNEGLQPRSALSMRYI